MPKIFNFIAKKRIPFLFVDIILIAFSVLAAFLVRFEMVVPARYFQNMEGMIFLAVLITIPIFYYLKLYSFSWIYVSTEELISLIKATALSFLIITSFFLILRDHPIFSGFPRSTLFISYFFIFVLCGGLRFAKRIYRQVKGLGDIKNKERTLIVGAGGAGEQVLRNVQNSQNSSYLPIGFIDDNLAKQDILIHGLKVLGKIEEIPDVVKEYNIDTLIIAFPSAGSKMIDKAKKKGIEAGIVNIKYLPPMDELINSASDVGIGELRNIDMEDLLGRETTDLEKKPIEEFLKNKKVLITGAAGSIGSELCRQVVKFNPASLLILDQDETGIFNILAELKDKNRGLKIFPIIADVRDNQKIEEIFKKHSPHIVFHAAAYKHVPLMEENVDEAIKNNIFGTETIVKAAAANESEKFVFISTDKAVNPTSVMGATKRVGEMICRAMNEKGKTKFISVRFGNVLGSRGSVVPIFKEQISRGGPITITHKDMRRYFMVTSEACLLVMQAGAMGNGGEVFVLDMGNPVKIIDLAKKLIYLSGFDKNDIKIDDSIGSRPGEKLFEELLTAEEGTLASQNKKIFIAKISNINEDKLNAALAELGKVTGVSDGDMIKKILKEIIPSYQSNIH